MIISFLEFEDEKDLITVLKSFEHLKKLESIYIDTRKTLNFK